VRLLDLRPILGLAPHETAIAGDAADDRVLRGALEHADAIIHLTGCNGDAAWSELYETNVAALRTMLAVAEATGIRRIAVASTFHVMGLYTRAQRVLPDMIARPDSAYAASKLLGEQESRWHATRTGTRVVSVRIGCYKPTREEAEPCAWIGPTDLARLFAHVLQHPRGDATIVHAVAPHRGDDCGQRALRWRHGFRFSERGESRRRSLERLSWWYPTDMVARHYRGGEFASRTLAT
jgi:hypothetical protein